MYAFLDLKINDYILLNFILFIYLLFLTGPQGQQCYTLMGFSILYKNSLLLLLLLLIYMLQKEINFKIFTGEPGGLKVEYIR